MSPVTLAPAVPVMTGHDADWLRGSPMDPMASPVEPLPPVPGFPFLHAGAGAVIVGPTGSGRSSLMEAGLWDAAMSGVRGAYLGSEIPEPEFNVRAARLAGLRGETIDDELRNRLAVVRYLDLTSVIVRAWAAPEAWVAGMVDAYDIVAIDPLSAVASALDFDFDRSNAEFVRFYDKLVQPLVTAGLTVVIPDNVGHAIEAKNRAKGASAKSDRADLTFSCSISMAPPGLVIRAQKVRTIRAGFQRGDEWLFTKDTQTIERRASAVVDGGGYWRPTEQMQRASEAVAAEPGIGKKQLRDRLPGRSDSKDAAIHALIKEGYIALQPGNRGGHHHHPIKPFDAESDEGPCPDRAQITVPTVPTVPHSVPTPCPVPAEDRAHRAITAERYGHGDGPGHIDADAELERITTKHGDEITT